MKKEYVKVDPDAQSFANEVYQYQSQNGVETLDPGEFLRAWMLRNEFLQREAEENASPTPPNRAVRYEMARVSLMLENELGSRAKAWAFIMRQAALVALMERSLESSEFAYLKAGTSYADNAIEAAALAPVDCDLRFDLEAFRLLLGFNHELQHREQPTPG